MRSEATRTLVRMDLRPALREHFGFDDFRPGQEDVVRAAVEGRDTLALMPTGAGKSLTYQLAAMTRACSSGCSSRPASSGVDATRAGR